VLRGRLVSAMAKIIEPQLSEQLSSHGIIHLDLNSPLHLLSKCSTLRVWWEIKERAEEEIISKLDI
jgi:hypothetical protein